MKDDLIKPMQPIQIKEDLVSIKNTLVDLGKVTHYEVGQYKIIFHFFGGTQTTIDLAELNPDKQGGFSRSEGKDFKTVVEFLKKRFKPKEVIK